MPVIQLTDYDRRVYEEELRDFLPEKFFDIHCHIYEPGTRKVNNKGGVTWTAIVAPDQTYEDLKESYARLFPGKITDQLIMASPNCYLDIANPYIESCIKKYGSKALYCTRWDSTEEEIMKAMNAGFIGIKPYLSNSPSYIPANEVRIYDFLPPEHLALMDKLGGYLTIHVPRNLRLRDPINIAQLMDIDEKYPNAKITVCHVGRAYIPEDVGDAFETLKHTKNLTYDFSANTCAYAMEKLIDAVGVERVMFASDMPFTKMRMRRIAENGTYVNLVPRGIYPGCESDPHMREIDDPEITTFMYEELRAFKATAEKLGLTKENVNDIMYNNASKYFGIKL